MAKKQLTRADGQHFTVNEGQSFDLDVTFHKPDGTAIDAADLLTIELTLYEDPTDSVINSRLDQDVDNANGGTVNGDGTLTLRLDADDNVIVDGTLTEGQTEQHAARVVFTYSDGTTTRTGTEERTFLVEKLAAPAAP